jgi:hypothetical protein
MNELRFDSVGGCRVSPSDGGGRFVVVPNVAKDLSAEIVHGGKNTPGNDLPLDLGEPNLDLVQPRRVGGGKVNVDLGITRRELVDELRVL